MSDCNQLNIFYEVAKMSAYDILVFRGQEPKLLPHVKATWFRKTFKILELIICHINIGRRILQNQNKDAIILHGFSTEFLLFTYLFSFFNSRNVYILTHHNVQQAFDNLLIRALLKLYNLLHYRFIINEESSVLSHLGFSEQQRVRHLSLLHPVVKSVLNQKEISNKKNNITSTKKIGVIGRISQGKQFKRTINLLLKMQEKLDFNLIIGTDDLSHIEKTYLNNTSVVDTSDRNEYFKALAMCDIVVLNYEKSKYFYRCSGVAADAIAVNTFVVCPNFPFMSNQINYPQQVGVTYDSELDLEEAIEKAFEIVSISDEEMFRMHYVERSIEKIAANFIKELEAQIVILK